MQNKRRQKYRALRAEKRRNSPGKGKSKRIYLEPGDICRHCVKTMDRFGHSDQWIPPVDTFWFEFWDICPNCNRLYHYDEARRFPDRNQNRMVPKNPNQNPNLDHDFFQDVVMDTLDRMSNEKNTTRIDSKDPPW